MFCTRPLCRPPTYRTIVSISEYLVLVDEDSHGPISWTAAARNEAAVDLLLSQPEVNLPNDVLHECIRKLRRHIHGADVNFVVDGLTPIQFLFSFRRVRNLYDRNVQLPVVKALVESSCDLSSQDQTSRTVPHIALDRQLEDVVGYLLEQDAGLSATATLQLDKWTWAMDKTCSGSCC